MVDSADHLTGKTGLTPTVTLSKNGAAFTSPAGAVTEIANGWYKIAGNATDANTLGPLILHATAAGADPVDVEFEVVAYDPQDAAALGLSTLTSLGLGLSGAITHTHTVYKPGGSDPLSGCAVYVTTTSDGSGTRSQTLYSDALGRVVFQLDAGTYYFWHTHPDYLFGNDPDTDVVA
jgi:hypothetical protein